MSTKNFIEGIKILQKYMEDLENHNIYCEHDVFYFDKTDNPISNADLDKLVNLGWFQEDAEYEDHYTIFSYETSCGWTWYV